MTMPELATIVQEKLKVNIAIINNGFLGMVRQWQEFFYDRNYLVVSTEGKGLARPAQVNGKHFISECIGNPKARSGAERTAARIGHCHLHELCIRSHGCQCRY
jgi:hypothetical protein